MKRDIEEETCGKCAETKIPHSFWGDVEHILPKSVYPERLLDYDNLTLACQRCNSSKADFDDPDEPLLNPYVDDPRDHLMGVGPMVRHVFGDRRAQKTVFHIGLNREGLIERRAERIEKVGILADAVASLPEGRERDAALEVLEQEIDRCAEYSFVVAAFLSLREV